jgi:MFS transporter, DHA3 family, macrolide efflux protein
MIRGVKSDRRAAPRQADPAATARGLRLTERIHASPYYPAITHPVLRRVLPGAAMSALGDGMSAVAIAWLALKLAPPGSRGLWVGAAVAAYSLPGAAGAVVLRRWLRNRGGARLVFVNALLRALALGLIGCFAIAGRLDLPAYVALLGASSLLSAWGVAGKYTLISDLLPAEHRIAGNTVFGLADQLSLMIGPALAGVVTAVAGPAVVIALDAASWVVLAISYARIAPLAARLAPSHPPPPPTAAQNPSHATPTPPQAGGWAVIRSSPVLPGLLALSFVFYLLYGPIEVALPVHVATDLHGSAALLGAFWAVFGVGAVIGELTAPFLRRWRVWPTMTWIVIGWGLAIVPLGLPAPLWIGLAAFFAGAVIWGPWMSLSMAVLQDASPPGALAQVIAARSSLLILASPLGTALGGPIVAALGARGTLLASGTATIVLGLITTAVLLIHRARHPSNPAPDNATALPCRFTCVFPPGFSNLRVSALALGVAARRGASQSTGSGASRATARRWHRATLEANVAYGWGHGIAGQVVAA